MPPRLPRLTLFTGGKECGLCEANLVAIRHTHPFEIKLWNIREPPTDAKEEEVHKWRRAYQYEIPVLHVDGQRALKNNITQEDLRRVLDEWRAKNAEGKD
ncbi:uncharacterized protein CcaverHIS019_0104980 [Cutaneotrichosporon cavernicola]|uniref:Glutaredoxin-like protein n=1 Tax=Cutaneotrichosporon cavernicola TaxID=279322 RepID=A0AA48I666_9TREE|nr:uncharacterized protein CcaverHIS019_0104980 [Cutaneotrichosporon cavernicola]BEI87780.1 hypothetical protein CcaverHIS019_0104980 [Cutaneotrichosporon cavernicola]